MRLEDVPPRKLPERWVLACVDPEGRTDYFGPYSDRARAEAAVSRAAESYKPVSIIDRRSIGLHVPVQSNLDSDELLLPEIAESVGKWMKDRYDLDLTTAQVQTICERQCITEVIAENGGVSDTYPREYWMDAIAQEWVGRDWPINMERDETQDFPMRLIEGYIRFIKGEPQQHPEH